MADRVPDVNDKDLALYRAIVGGGRKTPAPLLPATLRQVWAPRVESLVRLAQQRLSEGLRRFGIRR